MQSTDTVKHIVPYDSLKSRIWKKKLDLAKQYELTHNLEEAREYWVSTLGGDMYEQWKCTPWDFNGTTRQPRQGNIACGYFVTTVLKDMGVKLNRVKLAVCTSSEMMKALVPRQKLQNFSHLSYATFNDSIRSRGKGLYIIGLDYHTGFILNDGTESWFIHSNYIERKGVTKESILQSAALKVSKTRWMVSLTDDVQFLERWLEVER